jgi:transposase
LPAPRRVRELSEADLAELDRVYRTTNSADIRTRCHVVLLSSEGYSTPQVAHLVRFSEDTVLYWVDRYAAEGVAGLEDRPRSGRPPKS